MRWSVEPSIYSEINGGCVIVPSQGTRFEVFRSGLDGDALDQQADFSFREKRELAAIDLYGVETTSQNIRRNRKHMIRQLRAQRDRAQYMHVDGDDGLPGQIRAARACSA